jgi:dipeptidyl aminopeptidase/acylaminoacyl peptidase
MAFLHPLRPKRLAFALVAATAGAVLIASAGSSARAAFDATRTFPGRDGKIVFDRVTITSETIGNSRLMIVNSDGSGLRQIPIPRRVKEAGAPEWSPDGKWLSFLTQKSEVGGVIYIVRPNGSGLRPLIRTRKRFLQLADDWAPDGKHLVFTAENGWIYTVGLDGRHLKKLRTGLSPRWSPDGRHIAFYPLSGQHRFSPCSDDEGVAAVDIYVMTTQGKGLRVVATNMDASTKGLKWSPDGRSIIYKGLVPKAPASGACAGVYAATNGRERLIRMDDSRGPLRGETHGPTLSPDRRRLALSIQDHWAPLYGTSEIAVLNRDGGGLRVLTHNRPRASGAYDSDGEPDWQPVHR